jgi:hypothetical protein
MYVGMYVSKIRYLRHALARLEMDGIESEVGIANFFVSPLIANPLTPSLNQSANPQFFS